MRVLRHSHALFWSANVLAVASVCPASAQTSTTAELTDAGRSADAAAGASSADIGDVVVTGSRIDRLGFDAPTPTTVLGATEIQRANRPNIALVIADLPSVRATSTPQNTAANTNSGASTVDLRGLGDVRTLVLTNGRRFSGSADLNNVPANLVKRIDIVTGGASAAWGSGAVAGVVNIILDDSIEGLELGATGGVSSRGDGARYSADVRYGLRFADGAGHVMVSAAYQLDRGILNRNLRFGLSSALVPNPAFVAGNGQAAFILYPDVNYANASPSGLIVDGVLAGQTFQQDGSLRPFVFGSPRTASLMVGGEGENSSDFYAVFPPSKRVNLYGRATFDVGSVKLWADVSYANVRADISTRSEFFLGNLRISSDNAFLRPELRQRLATAGQASFQIGRLFDDYGLFRFNIDRTNFEGAAGIDGTFGGGRWRYSAYYGHGRYTDDFGFQNLLITQNFNNAVDSVIGPAGTPICRIALTNPSTDCRPLNVFGVGTASAAAVSYAFGAAASVTKNDLDTYGASLRGEPFSIFGKPASIAIGVEGRKESVKVTVDPRSAAQQFRTINLAAIKGAFSVKEAFGEIVVPVLNLPGSAEVELNAAARYSDYSTSGGIWSWKLGGTARLLDFLRLRAVQSRDIRSPSLNELYSQRFTTTTVIIDPRTNAPAAVTRLLGGNPALDPELADTTTLGASIAPKALPGLSFSVDYYRIKIGKAITALAAQDIVNGCARGAADLCALFTRDAAGQIGTIQASFVNVAKYETRGIDFDLSYLLALDRLVDGAAGRLRVRALATRVIETTVDTGVLRLARVGVVGDTASFNTPKWQGSLSLAYERPDATLDMRLRYVGGGVFDNTLSIQNNAIAARTYTDFGASVIVRDFTFGVRVNNAFDVKPPLITYRSPFYDTIGRYFTASVGVKF